MKNIYSLDKKEFKNAEKQFLKTHAGKLYSVIMWFTLILLALFVSLAFIIIYETENNFEITFTMLALLFPISFILMVNIFYQYLGKLNEYVKEK